MMKKILAGSIMLAMASAANAGVYTETKSFGTQGSTNDVTIGVLNETLTVDGFNQAVANNLIPAGATLTNVTITVEGQIDSAVTATNVDTNSDNARFVADLFLYTDWKVTSASATFNNFGDADAINPFSSDASSANPTDYTIAPGETWNGSIEEYRSENALSVNISDFLNPVGFNFTTVANTILQAQFPNGTGQVLQEIATASWGQVTVEYIYDEAPTPQVPEPGMLALLGLGLAGFGFGRARKRA